MRVLLNIKFPVQPFNEAVRDGSAGVKINRIMETMKPEAAYFTEQCGERSALIIVNLSDASKIPALAEPWFLTFDARVEVKPVMTPADLKKGGLEKLGQQWG